jgi:hypothetical protein
MNRWSGWGAAASAVLMACGTPADATTILFVGNSFTFGAYSPTWHYRAETVTDLNGDGVGGVPALFRQFADEAGLSYEVSLATHPGVGLDWHWANSLSRIDRAWDQVVLQSYSTLDKDRPGDPALLVDYSRRFAELLRARNPKVDIRLSATWSRADLTHGGPGPWAGKSIYAMADDLSCGYRLAARAITPAVGGVIEVGLAFNRAIRTGVADADPYDGIGFGQIGLWAWDHYHASAYGYYLEALMVFGAVTGKDPLALGAAERAAREMGFSPVETTALQTVAHDQLAADAIPDGRCAAASPPAGA